MSREIRLSICQCHIVVRLIGLSAAAAAAAPFDQPEPRARRRRNRTIRAVGGAAVVKRVQLEARSIREQCNMPTELATL